VAATKLGTKSRRVERAPTACYIETLRRREARDNDLAGRRLGRVVAAHYIGNPVLCSAPPQHAVKDRVDWSHVSVHEFLEERILRAGTRPCSAQRSPQPDLHAVIRLDPAGLTESTPDPFDVGLLSRAVQRAATVVSVRYPSTPGVVDHARWGSQLDLRAIGGDGRVVPGLVAAYLAKYATKSTDAAGLLDHRLREGDLEGLDIRLTPHLARMVRTAWGLGARTELEDLRLRAWSLGRASLQRRPLLDRSGHQTPPAPRSPSSD